MKLERIWMFALIFIVTAPIAAQYQPPKPPPEATQFDFMIGEWAVQGYFTTKKGQQAPFEASAEVQSTHGGWALSEDMKVVMAGHIVFHSTCYRAWNPRMERWVGKYFYKMANEWHHLEGTKQKDTMVMTSRKTHDGQIVRRTFHNISENQFQVTADVSHDNGVTWKKADTHLIYTRKN